MKMKRLIIFSIFLFLSTQVHSGWMIKEVTSNYEGNPTTGVIYLQKNRIKNVGSEIVVFDLEKGMIFILLPEEKIYYCGRPEEILNGANRAAELTQDSRLRDLSPEQRKTYMEYRDSLSKQKDSIVEKKMQIEVRKTREKAIVAGKPTQKFQVWVQGKLKEELWIYEKIKLKNEINLKKYVELMEAMSGPGKIKFYESSPEYMDLLEYGYSLKTIKYDEEGSRITEVIQIEQKTIPESEFRIPDDYQKVDIEEMWMNQMEMDTE